MRYLCPMLHALKLDIPPLADPIKYTDNILLTGSCFTEHISDRLQQYKFNVVSNPNGILFNPLSVADSLNGYLAGRQYTASDLFYLNELWNSWDHHTRFSDMDQAIALQNINTEQSSATIAIKQANWVMITLGSAFQYYLKESGKPVANNHRAPSQWFDKKLLSINVIIKTLGGTLTELFTQNPNVQVLFTISPVRHIRDGVVENNRSKARLIEAVHQLCSDFHKAHYFPAYELLIDILRDYRYYDIDMVHPNFMATSYVWEQFVQACINPGNHKLMEQVKEIVIASRHRPRFPDTIAHQQFRLACIDKAKNIMKQNTYINLLNELRCFEASEKQ